MILRDFALSPAEIDITLIIQVNIMHLNLVVLQPCRVLVPPRKTTSRKKKLNRVLTQTYLPSEDITF